ncbi:TPA_asm: S-ribosylhomocysteine lyase [Listeria innocua]|uniref:S-ribosylhomocysteine lyase n=1 Tax=Listeria innocua TaxID=1642 RepID=UPI0010B69213|nr:S-ribosylhomocysteine lyase [Listeria innocua]ECL8006257.1 S-ribosylhomocysteine lyase [Listeria innocua]ECQ6353355.1 S-ribosylhomocysteine lyase [Listeria innocua]EHW9790299.1 S-ribosylhomocysteine lyase [Listeria innocua]EIS4902204.1 S-ribosylhomocysteine lyase [Listeria innocua]EIS4929852.1 S-ribosylhomocysteine lyase [Listeria innocua]
MAEKMNVESFNLDHTKVKAPFVRLAGTKVGVHGDEIYKYDVRFKQPNKEHMEMPALHSLEHLMAELARNHTDKLVDISPMGCQTGFYMSFINHNDYDDALEILATTLTDVLAADAVPACNEVQCGWAASHSLEGAKQLAEEFLAKRSEWKNVFGE